MTSESELRNTWRSLSTSYNDIACELDRQMQSAHGLSMSDFEALDRLMDATTTSASALVGILPAVVFFLLFQRTLTRGVMAGAIK